jgi:hypothetical protein
MNCSKHAVPDAKHMATTMLQVYHPGVIAVNEQPHNERHEILRTQALVKER